jgi:nucleoside-diphosphate-sugar epimerase
MKVIVTGGSGGLGRAICSDLASRGASVESIDRRESADLPASVTQRVVDLADLDAVLASIEPADALVHCGNLPWFRHDHAHEALGLLNNTASTYHVLAACEQKRIPRVVNASSIHAYGCLGPKSPRDTEFSIPAYLPLDEDHPCLPVRPYALSKRNGELVCDSFAARFKWMRILSLRFSALAGINHPRPTTIRRTDAHIREHVGDALMSYTPAEIAMRAIARAIEEIAPGHRALNCMSRRSSNLWHATDIAAYFGRDIPFKRAMRPEESLIRPDRLEATLGIDCDVA